MWPQVEAAQPLSLRAVRGLRSTQGPLSLFGPTQPQTTVKTTKTDTLRCKTLSGPQASQGPPDLQAEF